MQEIANKVILCTGGTGSWGNEFVKQTLSFNPAEIRIYSRNEFAQVTMRRKFNDPRLKFIIGDIRDLEQLNYAMKGVNLVLHLAALKHIDICEVQPLETVKTNILGAENVIRAAIDNKVQKVINVSSDKACYPINIYGQSKAIGEKLFVNANNLSSTQFVCVRGGNVLGSNGSVVPLFIKQIQEDKEIKITDKRMTRFFLSLPQAISLLLVASSTSISGGIFVMKMKACRITDLAKVLINEFADEPSLINIKEVGMRPGEKLHEVLLNSYEAMKSYKYGSDYYVISPTEIGLEKTTFEEYSSNDELLDDKGIREMLIEGGFIGQ
jgi:FlaA1/EpsC-like NDP-sugar epimerase